MGQQLATRFELDFEEASYGFPPEKNLHGARLASIQAKLKQLDEWLRNRLRYCIGHDWKKPERKGRNLILLGVWSRVRHMLLAVRGRVAGLLLKARFSIRLSPYPD